MMDTVATMKTNGDANWHIHKETTANGKQVYVITLIGEMPKAFDYALMRLIIEHQPATVGDLRKLEQEFDKPIP